MKILIAIDCGQAGETVLRESVSFFKSVAPSELEVFTVMDLTPISLTGGLDSVSLVREMEERAKELKDTAARILDIIPFSFSTELGYPAEKIIEKTMATACDLLIIGTHGRTGLNHLLIGSVTEKILQHVGCNTLVVPLKHKQ